MSIKYPFRGLDLSEIFFSDTVAPLIREFDPNLRYAAARIGMGSEVLGLDDNTSQDHDWGPRLQIFLSEIDHREYSSKLSQFFSKNLPADIQGVPTHWGDPDLGDGGTMQLSQGNYGNINHRIEIFNLSEYIQTHLGICNKNPPFIEWCLIAEHHLLEFTAGKVFHDDIGDLSELRKIMSYYPREIWIYKMFSLWNEASELFHLMGRTGFMGDNFGSQLLSTRLAEIAAKLLFCICRKYAPYPKWFGTVFRSLEGSEYSLTLINKILYSKSWWDRQEALCSLYLFLGDKFNQMEIISPVIFKKQQFFNRPHFIVDFGNLFELLKDELPAEFQIIPVPLGTVSELIKLSQVVDRTLLTTRLRDLYKF